MTPAALTAFLYAGALSADLNTHHDAFAPATHFDDFNGHTGFVDSAETYATAIVQWLQARIAAQGFDDHPGVMEYELIEPLGGWLIVQSEVPSAQAVVARFAELYLAWIATTPEHLRTVALAGVMHQPEAEADKPADVERTLNTKNYEITLDLHGDHRGYFEHNTLGDERAGGLWYDENKNLTDYDGVAELPREVREALIADGFTSTEGCLDD